MFGRFEQSSCAMGVGVFGKDAPSSGIGDLHSQIGVAIEAGDLVHNLRGCFGKNDFTARRELPEERRVGV